VTFIAIASVAAICAGLVWYERRLVHRAARERAAARRERRPWDDWDDCVPVDRPTRRLVGAIRTAVFAGDVAVAHRDRLAPKIAQGESPFQFRRSRVDASIGRYGSAVDVVMELADDWLHRAGPSERPPAQRFLVERMITLLEEGRAPPGSSAGAASTIEGIIDVLENALAILHRTPGYGGRVHPFR
jgi:hypothetical protein